MFHLIIKNSQRICLTQFTLSSIATNVTRSGLIRRHYCTTRKTLCPFYHKKYFWWKMIVRHPEVVLHSFSIKNIFDDKMDFKVWDKLQPILVQCCTHKETSQLVCNLNQWIGFDMGVTLAWYWLTKL